MKKTKNRNRKNQKVKRNSAGTNKGRRYSLSGGLWMPQRDIRHDAP